MPGIFPRPSVCHVSRAGGEGPRRLPVYPRPLPDEWLGSWLARVARANALPVVQLMKALELPEREARLSEPELQRLSWATGVSVRDLIGMQTPPDPLRDLGRRGSELPLPFLGVRYVQVCPSCLLGDAIPYIRQDWVRRRVAACPEHGGRCVMPAHTVATLCRSPNEFTDRSADGVATCRSKARGNTMTCDGAVIVTWTSLRRTQHL